MMVQGENTLVSITLVLLPALYLLVIVPGFHGRLTHGDLGHVAGFRVYQPSDALVKSSAGIVSGGGNKTSSPPSGQRARLGLGKQSGHEPLLLTSIARRHVVDVDASKGEIGHGPRVRHP
ncbi:hypothetical protein C8T65DRAFT_747347 [Cerioporus squamosus]|nr:hypothetical protein C8T65DRAFT_747347 [Cerioporus squamosus]